ncbi:MAG: hypothetical protein QXO57_03965, partial [Candidatus Aenigmatarchaeota archaeon]
MKKAVGIFALTLIMIISPSVADCTREVLTPENDYTYIYYRSYNWRNNRCEGPFYYNSLNDNNLIVCDTAWLGNSCAPYSNSCPWPQPWSNPPRIYNSSITFPSIPSGRILVNANFSIYFNYNGCASVDVRVRNQQG